MDRAKLHSYIEMTYLPMVFLKMELPKLKLGFDRVKGFVTDVSNQHALVTLSGLRGQMPARMLVAKYS